MKTINATLINLYHVCHRELWLHAQGIRMEHTSEVVYEGKLIGETTYGERADSNTQLSLEWPLGGGWSATAKIDFYDSRRRTVHETKKSGRMEAAHVAQVKFYLWLLQKNGVKGATGIIEYPRQRQRLRVSLEPGEEQEIERWIAEVRHIISAPDCPGVIDKPLCKRCSYFEFCYSGEL